MIFNFWTIFFSDDNPYLKEIYSLLESDLEEYKKINPQKILEEFVDPNKPYKLPLPFSDELMYATKEEFEAHITQQKERVEEEKQSRKYRKQRREKLESIWYINEGENSFAWEYEATLLQIFSQEGVSHVDKVSEHVRLLEQKNTTALQLFSQISWIVKKEQVDDYYVSEIKKTLDEYEEMIQKYYFLKDHYFRNIQDLFVKWSVRDLELFARFENLKKENRKNYYIANFKFWWDAPFRKKSEILKETDIVRNHDMHGIVFVLGYYDYINLEDLESDKYSFIQKFEKSYKWDVKMDILYHSEQFLTWLYAEKEDLFCILPDEEKIFIKDQIKKRVNEERWNCMTQSEKNQIVRLFQREDDKLIPLDDDAKDHLKDWEKYRDRYSWFHSSKMQTILHIDKKMIEDWQYETKKEIIQDFDKYFDLNELKKLNEGNFYNKVHNVLISLNTVPKLLDQIFMYQKDFGLETDVSAIRKKIVKNLSDLYIYSIQKIKNKETIEYGMWPKSNLEHKMSRMLFMFKDLRKIIVTLDPKSSKNLPSIQQIDDHIKEYLDHLTWKKIQDKIGDLNISSISQLTNEDRDQIEKIFVEKTKKRYIELLSACVHDACGRWDALVDGIDHITRWLEPELLKLWLIRSIDDITKWDEKIKDSSQIYYADDSVSPEQEEAHRKRREKFYVFQRRVVKEAMRDIQQELLDYKKFHKDKISILQCLQSDYIAYYGEKKDVEIDREIINKAYYTSLKNKIKWHMWIITKGLESEKNERKDYNMPYIQHCQIANQIGEFIHHMRMSDNEYRMQGIEKLVEHNMSYENQYSPLYLKHLALWWYTIEEVIENLPEDIHQYFDKIFKKLEIQRPIVLKLCIQYWFFENGIIGGKLQRMVQNSLLQNQIADQDQIHFTIDFISENLSHVLWDDFGNSVLRWTWNKSFMIWTFMDEELVKSIVQEFLEKWKQRIEHKMKLWESNKPIEIK